MRNALLLLFSSFTFFVAAQTHDPLPWSVNRHIYFARYAKAKAEAEAAVKTRATAPDSYGYAIALSELGRVRLMFARYKAADSLLTTALSLFERQNATADSAYLKTCAWAAENCRSLAQFPRAEAILQRGFKATEAYKNTPHQAFQADLLLEYANLDAEMSRFQQAEAHYAEALSILEKSFGMKSPKVAAALTTWGSFENNTRNNYKAAEPLLARSMEILEPVARQHPVEYLIALTEQARLFTWGLPRYREGQQMLEKAVDFGKKQLGPRHPWLAWTLRVLASYYENNTPFFHRADNLFQEAADILIFHFGENYPSHIGTLQDISNWYGTLGDAQKADETRQRAYEICRKVYGDRHPTTANLLLAFAKTRKSAGKPLEADSLLQIVDTLYRDFYGDVHTSRIEMLQTLAGFASSRQNYPVADSLYHQALAKEEQLNGRESSNWWSIIDMISLQSWASDQPDRADSLDRSKMLFDSIRYGKMSRQYASDWRDLYFVYNSSASNKPLEAERAIRKSMSIIENILGKENPDYLFDLNQLTSTLVKQRRFEEAEKVIAQRETLVKKMYREKSGPWIDILDDKITLYTKSRTPSEVIPYRRQALALRWELGDMNGYRRGMSSLSYALTDLGQYAEADSLTQQLLKIYRNQYGIASGDYLLELFNAAFLYNKTDEYQKMKACLDSAVVVDQLLGNGYESLINKVLGNYYEAIGDYKEAARIWLKELENEPDAGNHNRYGGILTELGQYARADSILRVGLSKVEDNPDLEIALYLGLFNNLNLWGKNQKEAFEFIQKALDLAKKTYGENHPDYAVTLNSYAIALGKIGRFEEEEAILKKVLNLQTENPADYATGLSNLGILYYGLGRIQEAAALTIQALQIRERTFGADHPDCISSKQHLADYYISGFWKPLEADSLITLATDYWQKRAPQSRQYADAILLRGKFFTYIGEFEKAETQIKKASEIFKTAIGPESWEVSNCLNELALTYTEASKQVQGDRKKDLMLRALENELASMSLETNLYGTETINHATHLNNIAAGYYQIGNADSIIHYQLLSLELRKRLQGENNPATGSSYSQLAGAYEMQHRYREAEENCRKALAILAETTGKESEDYILCARGLGSILLAMGRKTEAFPYFEEDRKATRAKITKSFGYLSSREQIKVVQRYRPDYYYSAASAYNYPELARMCYNDALLFKGTGLRNNRTLRNILSASKDSTELQHYDHYLNTEKAIAAAYRLPKAERTCLDSLQNASSELQRELMAHSADYLAYIERFKVDWQAVQAKLKPGNAAIEFVRYNKKRVIDTDTFFYAALVLLPGKDAPVFVSLCTEEALEKKLRGEKGRIPDRTDGWAAALYRPQSLTRAITADPVETSLYDLIWKPLENAGLLKGVKRISFSPDGLLHQISFAALGYTDQSGDVFLSNRFELVQIASTGQLVSNPSEYIPAPNNEVLVVGKVDYGIRTAVSDPSRKFCVADPLEKEFDPTCEIYRQNGQKVTALSGKEATEKNVMEQMTKPFRAISIITHGLFLPTPAKYYNLQHLYSEVNPMQRSCLVFAGFNRTDTIQNHAEDCLLTAQDFAGLNLKGTELVAITACQSGLGDVMSSEGVFGLQRAFREAGVRYLIISLWDLPDKDTDEFMQEFYKLWLEEKNSVPVAFRAAQKVMRTAKGNDIEKWAGLILIE